MENLFKAVGIIEGEVNFPENKEEPTTILIEGKHYRLLTIPTAKGHRAIGALKGQVVNHGKKQKLIVYPRVLHLPAKDVMHTVSFSVVGFKNEERADDPNTLWNKLEINEFYISGLFQKIPVCKFPVLTVFKNLTDDRIEFIKKATAIERAGFMRPNHIPVNYHSPVVPPFLYSKDKANDQQSIKFFIELKVLFNPNRDVFVFDTLENVPQEKPPKHMHVSKRDKQDAMLEKKKRNALNGRKQNTTKASSKPNTNPQKLALKATKSSSNQFQKPKLKTKPDQS